MVSSQYIYRCGGGVEEDFIDTFGQIYRKDLGRFLIEIYLVICYSFAVAHINLKRRFSI